MYKTKSQHIRYLMLVNVEITKEEIVKQTGASMHTVNNNLNIMYYRGLIKWRLVPTIGDNFTYVFFIKDGKREDFIEQMLRGSTASRCEGAKFKLVTNHTAMKIMIAIEKEDTPIKPIEKITGLRNVEINRYMKQLELAGWIERKGFIKTSNTGKSVLWGITKEGKQYCEIYRNEWKGVFF